MHYGAQHMRTSSTRLDALAVVRCVDTSDGSEHGPRMPDPTLLANISSLWRFLELVVEDWKRHKAAFQEPIDRALNGEVLFYHRVNAFAEIQPYFLKCLFSYAMFFEVLDQAYEQLYAELNVLNHQVELNVQHAKPPRRSTFVEKVKRIRDWSIAHPRSIAHSRSRHASAIDSLAGASWTPMAWDAAEGQAWDLEKLTFGAFRWRSRDRAGNVKAEAADFEIKGILEMDRQCTDYLQDFDAGCAEYLSAILARLPVIVGSHEYRPLQ